MKIQTLKRWVIEKVDSGLNYIYEKSDDIFDYIVIVIVALF